MKETPQGNTKRLQWVDIAKGLGIILVVIGHSKPPTGVGSVISAFHMPLFFFLSGLVYHKRDTSISIIKAPRLKKDFVRLIIPYCLTVFVVAVFLRIIQSHGRHGYYDSMNGLLKSALFGSGSGYQGIKLIGEIWFLLAMFWTRRIMDVVFLCDKKRYRLIIVGIFVGIGIALASTGIWVPTNIDIAFVAIGFMYAGWIVQQQPALIENHYIICILIMISFAALSTSSFGMSNRNYSNMWFVSMPGAIAMSMLICIIAKLIGKIKGIRAFLAFVGKHSLLFICIHSIDWRMPFPKLGQSLITPYNGYDWYWALSGFHRFLFDLLITVVLLSGLKLFRLLISKCKQTSPI